MVGSFSIWRRRSPGRPPFRHQVRGTGVEAMQDVHFRLAPMTEASAGMMIKTIKAYKVLKGIRGAGPSDINAIKDCLLRFINTKLM